MATADNDYNRLRELVYYFVKSERSPKQARSAIFYTYVQGCINQSRVADGEKESLPMNQVRSRYAKGLGGDGEPTAFYNYFYRKFRRQIQEERLRQTGNKYSRKQRYS